MATQTPAKKLFDLLTTKDFNPETLDSSGKPASDPGEADVFSFDYVAQSGNDYGTAVVMLSDDSDLQIYFGDNLGKSMDHEDKSDWYSFLGQLKDFATKNLLSFSPKNLNRLRYSMQGQAAIKEGLFESWSGNKTTSWNGKPTEARLMIRHKKTIGEGDARYRYVESLFVETADGERFKLPFTKLAGGRAMVEHIRQGGRVWDPRGQHITEMVEEINVISRFRRANQGKVFEGDTLELVNEANQYYESLQRDLKHISSGRGYTKYFESWNPEVITEEETVVEGLKHLFVTQSLDNRIEDALPLLAKIQQQGQAMKEANIFEAWVNDLMEGTWNIPDTPEKKSKLKELMSKPLAVGPDATNATEQLYDLLGDDELFDQLETLAEKDPDADCRQIVYDRMQMLSNDPDIQEVINALTIDPEAEMNPAPQVNPDDVAEEVKDPATQTEDPAGTEQPMYPEYADDLESILKHAGVPAENRPAPDYEEAVCEDGEEQLDEFAPLAAAIGSALGRAAVGATASTIEKGLAGMAGSAIANKLASDEEDYVDEAELDEKLIGGQKKLDRDHDGELTANDFALLRKGNKVDEEKESALQGQYGHSGKLKPIGESPDFLTRLKELSGMIRN